MVAKRARWRGVAVLLGVFLTASCTEPQDEITDGEVQRMICEAFDIAGVEGLTIPDAAETRVRRGAFLDGYGRCMVHLHGGRALALEVDFADSQAAQAALADERGKTEDLSVAGATGFAGLGGTFGRNGGRAVLGDDARVVRVTVEPSVIVDGAEADRVAGDLAIVVLNSLNAQRADDPSAALDPPSCGGLDADLVEEVLPAVEVSQRGVPMSPRLGERDPRGNCTLDGPDGRPLLEVTVDATDTTFANQLRSRDSWQTETVDGPDGAGWAGRLGPADDAGGYAVLEREDTIVSVTLHQSREGRDAAADALEVARAALDIVAPTGV